MLVRQLHPVPARLAVLAQPPTQRQPLRGLLTLPAGRLPARRTWERRLATLPDTLPAQLGCLGRHVVALSQPWATGGRAAAIESTVLRAKGGGWQQQDRAAGVVPHPSIAPEAHWTSAQRAPAWPGWSSGWQRHLVTTVAAVWLPLAARLTPAHVAAHESAPALRADLPAEVRFVLGDRHDHTPAVRAVCQAAQRGLVTAQAGRSPHPDDGVAVRRVCHQLRSLAHDNCNGQCTGSVAVPGAVPTSGLGNTQRFALGAVVVSQLTLWYRHEHGLALRVGLHPFLKAA